MYKTYLLPHFAKQLKPLLKKYRSLKKDLLNLLGNFDKRQHQSLGNNTYKARLKSSDIPRGKSKAFRLIVFIVEKDKLLLPIAIYFKGRKSDVSKKEINYHLAIILQELENLP